MKSHLFVRLVRIAFVLALVALLVAAFVLPALAAPAAQAPAPLPSDWLSLILTITVAQAVGWVLTVLIPFVVAYALGWFPNASPALKAIVGTVLIATLTAAVTSLASFIPDAWMQAKLIDAIVAIVGLIAAGFTGWKFGAFKAAVHYVAANSAHANAKALAATK